MVENPSKNKGGEGMLETAKRMGFSPDKLEMAGIWDQLLEALDNNDIDSMKEIIDSLASEEE